MPRATTVDEYIEQSETYHAELTKLRGVLNATCLEETVKWGAPCYTHNGKNVVGLAAFKSYVGLWFHQGALLKDPDKLLINASEGKTKALRQMRFEKMSDIKVRTIKAYVKEAIEHVDAGKEIKADRSKPVTIPPELDAVFKKRKKTKAAFDALTKGKQRDYAEHIASAKREATKQSRLEKIIPMIEAGAGLHDKYKNC
ncbi:MAG: DUF1801 domain-containing protein [Planctomycetota bacterium]